MFTNRIRLPLYTRAPQFPTEANRFRLANGTTKTQSVVIRKNYTVLTDYMSEQMHQRLVIALNHDTVTIEGDRYIGGIAVSGEYTIEWPEFLDYPLGQATVQIEVTPFDATNSNCQTCDVLTQLELTDDDAGEIEEGEAANVNVYTNDEICCFPVTAEITWFDTGYLASATIDQATGVVTLTAKDPVSPVGSIKLATYRITCPDGTYDEADIYGSISGSGEACEQPSSFEPTVFSLPPAPYDITEAWAAPAVPPVGGYEWAIYDLSTPGAPILTGTTMINEANFQVPSSDTTYSFVVRSVCGEGITSPWSNHEFTTPGSGSVNCGSYQVTCNDGSPGSLTYWYSFLDCDGNMNNSAINNLATRTECFLESSPGVPAYFESVEGYVTYVYIEPC